MFEVDKSHRAPHEAEEGRLCCLSRSAALFKHGSAPNSYFLCNFNRVPQLKANQHSISELSCRELAKLITLVTSWTESGCSEEELVMSITKLSNNTSCHGSSNHPRMYFTDM